MVTSGLSVTVIGVGDVRTQKTREVANQACGTKSSSSPVYYSCHYVFSNAAAWSVSEKYGPRPSCGAASLLRRRRPRRVHGGDGRPALGEVWTLARAQTCGGLGHTFCRDLS